MIQNSSIFSYLKPKAKQNPIISSKSVNDYEIQKPQKVQVIETIPQTENIDYEQVELKLREFDNLIKYGPALGKIAISTIF